MRKLMQRMMVAGMAAGMVLAAAMADAASAATLRGRAAASAFQPEKAEKAKANDVLIFRNGRKVEGTILEENDSVVKIRIVMAGGLTAETSYNKSEILVIERGTGEAATDAGKDSGKNKPATPKAKSETPAPKTAATEAATKVYFVTLTGEFGRDVSETPLRDIVRDARAHQPDYLIFQIDTDFKMYGQELREFAHVFDQLFRAEKLAPILTQEIRDDPEWTKKPQVVFWVKRAMGGAAFLPFISPTVYFHSEGRMGGIGRLETIFGSTGDEVVREKQFSLRMGHAEGLAIAGGHAPELVRAMVRTAYVLSVDFRGGKPVYRTDYDGELKLTDDGDGDNKDTDPFFGNDVLTLNAEVAYQLGFSRGTVDQLEDLLFDLGIARDYVLVEGRGERIFKEWGASVENAEGQIRRMFQDMGEMPIGGDFDERTRARGFHIKTLRQIKSLLERFKEALNPYNVSNPPQEIEGLITNINLALENLIAEARNDRR